MTKRGKTNNSSILYVFSVFLFQSIALFSANVRCFSKCYPPPPPHPPHATLSPHRYQMAVIIFQRQLHKMAIFWEICCLNKNTEEPWKWFWGFHFFNKQNSFSRHPAVFSHAPPLSRRFRLRDTMCGCPVFTLMVFNPTSFIVQQKKERSITVSIDFKISGMPCRGVVLWNETESWCPIPTVHAWDFHPSVCLKTRAKERKERKINCQAYYVFSRLKLSKFCFVCMPETKSRFIWPRKERRLNSSLYMLQTTF